MDTEKILKLLRLRKKSDAEIANQMVQKNHRPSQASTKIVGKVSQKKINEMMAKAVDEYNNDNHAKIFSK